MTIGYFNLDMTHIDYEDDINSCQTFFNSNLPNNALGINEKDDKTESVVKVIGAEIAINNLFLTLVSGIQQWRIIDMAEILTKVKDPTWAPPE